MLDAGDACRNSITSQVYSNINEKGLIFEAPKLSYVSHIGFLVIPLQAELLGAHTFFGDVNVEEFRIRWHLILVLMPVNSSYFKVISVMIGAWAVYCSIRKWKKLQVAECRWNTKMANLLAFP